MSAGFPIEQLPPANGIRKPRKKSRKSVEGSDFTLDARNFSRRESVQIKRPNGRSVRDVRLNEPSQLECAIDECLELLDFVLSDGHDHVLAVTKDVA